MIRALAWSYLAGLVVGWVGAWAGVPTWAGVPAQWLTVVVVYLAVRRGWIRHLWLRWRHRHALRAPVVVDEDDVIHVPVLLPGESIEVHHHGAQRHVRVLTASGRVRAEWPRRH